MKKLTLQQYEEIVDIADNGEGQNAVERVYTKLLSKVKLTSASSREEEINARDYAYQAMAVANPLTREWAQENCVKDTRQFVWQSKESGQNGKAMYLLSKDGKIVLQESTGKLSDYSFLSQTDVSNAGYEPDDFNKVKEYGVYN